MSSPAFETAIAKIQTGKEDTLTPNERELGKRKPSFEADLQYTCCSTAVSSDTPPQAVIALSLQFSSRPAKFARACFILKAIVC